MALQLGDVAPDFEAETTQGRISFHEWIGRFLVCLIFASEGFYAGLHHRTRLYGEDQAGV